MAFKNRGLKVFKSTKLLQTKKNLRTFYNTLLHSKHIKLPDFGIQKGFFR